MSEVILKAENVSKIYMLGKQKVPALSNLNLHVHAGEFVAIKGPSGSGKTTLLNMLGCIDKPTSGSVFLDGVDVTKLPESDLFKIRRKKIGFVFQTFNLLPYLNARENVELPMTQSEKSKGERKRRASELLGMVGLSGREQHRPQRLSGGEQQRVAIARALANDPAIILADEPTGNLGTKNKLELMKLLADLNSKSGTTIVVVTHDTHVASLCNRVLLLRDGSIVKERKGLNLAENKEMCPYCGSKVSDADSLGFLFREEAEDVSKDDS
jgi:putative ABC transport system ATP-binding protein